MKNKIVIGTTISIIIITIGLCGCINTENDEPNKNPFHPEDWKPEHPEDVNNFVKIIGTWKSESGTEITFDPHGDYYSSENTDVAEWDLKDGKLVIIYEYETLTLNYIISNDETLSIQHQDGNIITYNKE